MKKFLIIVGALSIATGAGLLWLHSKAIEWQEKGDDEQASREHIWKVEQATANTLPQSLSRVDTAIQNKNYARAEKLLAGLATNVPRGLAPFIAHREAEMHYEKCERHAGYFIRFIVTKMPDEASAEREIAQRECDAADKILRSIADAAPSDQKFYVKYGLGNTSVRRAFLAVSEDAQIEMLDSAIGFYEDALEIKPGDYQTKINLELLFDLFDANAKEAGKGKGQDKKLLPPNTFDLAPGGGASSSSGLKGRL